MSEHSEAKAQRDYAKGEEGFYVVNQETDFAVSRQPTYKEAAREVIRREWPPDVLRVVEIVHPPQRST